MSQALKVLFILLSLFIALQAMVFAAEEFTGTYKETERTGKGDITIILDRDTGSVTGSVTGTGIDTNNSEPFNFNGTLKGTYDKVSGKIKGTVTGYFIFSSTGKRIDFSDKVDTFEGIVTDSKITGNFVVVTCGESLFDIFGHDGDFTCTSSSNSSSGKYHSKLAINGLTFLTAKNGSETDKSVFNPGDTMWLKYVVTGFSTDNNSNAWVREDIIIEDSQGNELQRYDKVTEYKNTANSDTGLTFPPYIPLRQNAAPGNYIIHFVIIDEYSGEKVEQSIRYSVQ